MATTLGFARVSLSQGTVRISSAVSGPEILQQICYDITFKPINQSAELSIHNVRACITNLAEGNLISRTLRERVEYAGNCKADTIPHCRFNCASRELARPASRS